MRKSIFIAIVIVAILAIGISGYIFFGDSEKITVSFVTNNESTLDSIEIKKGESINLPILERDGYEFLGWYIDGEKIDNNYKFDKITILSARWEKEEILNYNMVIYCQGDTYCQDYETATYEKVSIPTKNNGADFLLCQYGFVLYNDVGLRIYNLKERKIVYKNIKLDTNLTSYELYFSKEQKNVLGIGYIKNGYYGYYNLNKNISLYENKYKAVSDSLFTVLEQINDHYLSLTINNNESNQHIYFDSYLLSSDEEKEILHDLVKVGRSYISYENNGKYVYLIEATNKNGDDIFKVYFNSFKHLFENVIVRNGKEGRRIEDYVNVLDNSLYVLDIDNNVVKKYDYDGKLLSTSKKYENPLMLIGNIREDNNKMFGNNYILYIKDGNLILENTDNDNEFQKIPGWNDEKRIGIHAFYTKEKANIGDIIEKKHDYAEGIYVSIVETVSESDNCTVEGRCYPSSCYKEDEYCYTKNELISYPSEAVCVAADKPIIYLYPEQEMDIEIKVNNPNLFTTVYPKYNDGWKVFAKPDGTLIDKNTGRKLYGLYWEGKNYPAKVTDEGFVIKGEDTASFLEEKLDILGLSEREMEEFIIYWLPKMEHNKYNYIRFASMEEINNYMMLDINPKPDTLIRIMMEYMPLNEKIEVKEQRLKKIERHGFTAVEWGGSNILEKVIY